MIEKILTGIFAAVVIVLSLFIRLAVGLFCMSIVIALIVGLKRLLVG